MMQEQAFKMPCKLDKVVIKETANVTQQKLNLLDWQ